MGAQGTWKQVCLKAKSLLEGGKYREIVRLNGYRHVSMDAMEIGITLNMLFMHLNISSSVDR